jgi:hypothetical protein
LTTPMSFRSAQRCTHLPRLLAPLALLAGLAAPGTPCAGTIYDAVLGLPQAQGWVETVQTNPPASIVPSLGPEGLHFSTLHLQSTGNEGGWTSPRTSRSRRA